MTLILRVNTAGHPLGWITRQDAVLHYVKEQVVWTLGEPASRIYGGVRRLTGKRSVVELHPVLAIKGAVRQRYANSTPPLTNRELFRRDKHTCLYCLDVLPDKHLTRDHVKPVSRGGKNHWGNVVTCCMACNLRKGARTPEEANMPLHAVPFVPNYAEWLILRNRNILSDQMAFLKAQCPKERRNNF
jgi:5-methylcytosine-specific restriction endonuclease McrA